MSQILLVAGNSRLHWGYVVGWELIQRWDTPHLLQDLQELPASLRAYLLDLPIYGATVVPSQQELISRLVRINWLTLESIPLENVYPSLGIDRALAVYGAGKRYGFPCLVIDAGTALTFTGVDGSRSLVGGGILPGLGLQLGSLGEKTAQLPQIILPSHLPPRWAKNTRDAIASGILYTLLAGIRSFSQDWWRQFPESDIFLTGGDAPFLYNFLQQLEPAIAKRMKVDLDLAFWGLSYLSI
jgi:type III pantothenate kinase